MASRKWIDPASVVARYREANKLYKSGRFDEAIAILEEVQAAYPKQTMVTTALNMCRETRAKVQAREANGHEASFSPEPEHTDSVAANGILTSDYALDETDEAEDAAFEAIPADDPAAYESEDENEFIDREPDISISSVAPDRMLMVVDQAPTSKHHAITVSLRFAIAAGIAFGILCGLLFSAGRWLQTAPVSIEGTVIPVEAPAGLTFPNTTGAPVLSDEGFAAQVKDSQGVADIGDPIVPAGQRDGATLWHWGEGLLVEVIPTSTSNHSMLTLVVCDSESDFNTLSAAGVASSQSWRAFAGKAGSILVAVPAATLGSEPEAKLEALVRGYMARFGLADARVALVGYGEGARAAWAYVEYRPERIVAAALAGWSPQQIEVDAPWQAALPLVIIEDADNSAGRHVVDALRTAAQSAGVPARARYVNVSPGDNEAHVTEALLAALQRKAVRE